MQCSIVARVGRGYMVGVRGLSGRCQLNTVNSKALHRSLRD